MKRMTAIFAAAILCLACAACGCRNSAPATTPTIRPTVPTTMPATLPTMETNIPDPEVNDNSTMGTDSTDSTRINDGTGVNNGSSAARNRSMTGGMK